MHGLIKIGHLFFQYLWNASCTSCSSPDKGLITWEPHCRMTLMDYDATPAGFDVNKRWEHLWGGVTHKVRSPCDVYRCMMIFRCCWSHSPRGRSIGCGNFPAPVRPASTGRRLSNGASSFFKTWFSGALGSYGTKALIDLLQAAPWLSGQHFAARPRTLLSPLACVGFIRVLPFPHTLHKPTICVRHFLKITVIKFY